MRLSPNPSEIYVVCQLHPDGILENDYHLFSYALGAPQSDLSAEISTLTKFAFLIGWGAPRLIFHSQSSTPPVTGAHPSDTGAYPRVKWGNWTPAGEVRKSWRVLKLIFDTSLKRSWMNSPTPPFLRKITRVNFFLPLYPAGGIAPISIFPLSQSV